MNIKWIYLRDKLKNYIKKSQKNSYDNVSKRLITPPAIGQLCNVKRGIERGASQICSTLSQMFRLWSVDDNITANESK